MYERLRSEIEKYQNDTIARYDEYIDGKTVGEILSTAYLRNLTTKTTLESLQKADPGMLPDGKVVEKMKAKEARNVAKTTKGYYEKLETAESYDLPNEINIMVEFKRHPIWNYNPTVTVTCGSNTTKGHASGCGYDKESSAVAGALNQNPQILKVLYDYAESGREFPYGVYTFAGVPFFANGVGVNCYRDVFEKCGYTWEAIYNGKHENLYRITKN